jgi:hypothetical protein
VAGFRLFVGELVILNFVSLRLSPILGGIPYVKHNVL